MSKISIYIGSASKIKNQVNADKIRISYQSILNFFKNWHDYDNYSYALFFGSSGEKNYNIAQQLPFTCSPDLHCGKKFETGQILEYCEKNKPNCSVLFVHIPSKTSFKLFSYTDGEIRYNNDNATNKNKRVSPPYFKNNYTTRNDILKAISNEVNKYLMNIKSIQFIIICGMGTLYKEFYNNFNMLNKMKCLKTLNKEKISEQEILTESLAEINKFYDAQETAFTNKLWEDMKNDYESYDINDTVYRNAFSLSLYSTIYARKNLMPTLLLKYPKTPITFIDENKFKEKIQVIGKLRNKHLSTFADDNFQDDINISSDEEDEQIPEPDHLIPVEIIIKSKETVVSHRQEPQKKTSKSKPVLWSEMKDSDSESENEPDEEIYIKPALPSEMKKKGQKSHPQTTTTTTTTTKNKIKIMVIPKSATTTKKTTNNDDSDDEKEEAPIKQQPKPIVSDYESFPALGTLKKPHPTFDKIIKPTEPKLPITYYPTQENKDLTRSNFPKLDTDPTSLSGMPNYYRKPDLSKIEKPFKAKKNKRQTAKNKNSNFTDEDFF